MLNDNSLVQFFNDPTKLKLQEIRKPVKVDHASWNVFTIGFMGKNLEKFDHIIRKHKISVLIDVRRYPNTHRSGWAKRENLKYFILNYTYLLYTWEKIFAPPKTLLRKYKKTQNWREYVKVYVRYINNSQTKEKFMDILQDRACFLCAEKEPDQCHRRLLVERMKDWLRLNYEIIHLT